MKKYNWILVIVVIAAFFLFAAGSTEEETGTASNQGHGNASIPETVPGAIGEYTVVIDSCRLAKDYEGKDVVIVKYVFTNVADESPEAFMFAFDCTVYQNGVGLNESYLLDESANYSPDNQSKEIKKGASIEVEEAYELNDTTTDIEVEVEELFSFDDKKIVKSFSIAK